eukprot:g15461.t1
MPFKLCYKFGLEPLRDQYYEDPRGNTFILSDYNATALSVNQCRDKGLNVDAHNRTSEAPKLDHVSGGHFPKGSYLSPRSIVVENFPALQITISVWLRTVDTSAPGIIFAFLSNNTLRKGGSREYEFALYDARNLKAMIKTSLPTSQQLKNPHLRQANREFTSGATVNDGEWRFISITWQSQTGACRIYVDGGHVASSQFAFNAATRNTLLEKVGRITVGSAIEQPGFTYTGELQNIQVWMKALSDVNILRSMQWPTGIDHPSVLQELLYFWRFTGQHDLVHVNSSSIVAHNIAHEVSGSGWMEDSAAVDLKADDLVDTNSTGALYAQRSLVEVPCVEDVQWYFSAPSLFAGDLRDAYDGRLEFFLRSPDNSGSPRIMRNFVIIEGGTDSQTIFNNLKEFPAPSKMKWTPYVIVLREDFGWTTSKGVPPSFDEMWDILGNVRKISIR